MWRAAILVLCGACGRLGFDPLPHSDGARGDSPGDATCADPVAALSPPAMGPFAAPVAIAELNDPAGSDDPTLTEDMREIYFQSTRGGLQRIWRATRATSTALWSPPTPMVELDAYSANTPEVSRDGLTLYYAAPHPVGGQQVTYVMTRADRSSAWGVPALVEALAIPEGTTGAVPFFDGRALMYATTAAGGPGGADLWLALRTGDACSGFGLTSPIPGQANTPSAEANGWIRNDGLGIAFTSDRAGGLGNGDIWMATRASVDVGFETAVAHPELDSFNPDDDPWMNDAMDTIIYVTTRNGFAELYIATR